MSKKVKYALATLATIFMAYSIFTGSSIPYWYGMLAFLSCVMWTFFFGIAENAYKNMREANLRAMPMTIIGAGLTTISGVFAFIQIILIMQH